MSAVAAPAPPATRPRPVPWTRLAWVTWRQHRVALAGVAVLLGGLGLYLLIMGLKIHNGYASVMSCHPAHAAACLTLSDLFNRSYYPFAETFSAFLLVLPVLVGVFMSAPALARELETGTFRFAWTQGCGRLRWVITKLALLAVAVIAASYAFSLLWSWYFQVFFAEGFDGLLAQQFFDLRGVAFAAWTLLAFAIGAIAGALVRRTVPAIAASIAVWTGLDFAINLFLRKHYQAPLLSTSGTVWQNNWVLNQWWTGPNGTVVSQQTIRDVVTHAPGSVRNSPDSSAVTAYLTAHHYTQWASYQPESRYWHFQFIEGGWLLVLSLILLAGTVWLVRNRAA
jgi:ABC-2 family transporter protein